MKFWLRKGKVSFNEEHAVNKLFAILTEYGRQRQYNFTMESTRPQRQIYESENLLTDAFTTQLRAAARSAYFLEIVRKVMSAVDI